MAEVDGGEEDTVFERVVAVALLALFAACSADSDDTALEAKSETTGSTPGADSRSARPDGPSVAAGDQAETFRRAVSARCNELFDRLTALAAPTNAGELREALDAVLASTSTWKRDVETLPAPDSIGQDWPRALDDLQAALDRGAQLSQGPLAEIDPDAPVSDSESVLSGEDGVAFDESFVQAQEGVNELLNLDCFDVPS